MLQQMVALLERLGLEVGFPPGQTCCGQPLFNNGFTERARPVARAWLDAFAGNPAPVVGPSGSCVSMVRHHFAELFPPGTPEHTLAAEVTARTYEFTEFLVHQLKVTDVGASYPHRVTYHASCHYLREMGLRNEAKLLLNNVRGLELVPLTDEETCCGFGGAFSVTFPEVSRAMLDDKVRNILAGGTETVVTCEPGCLMNIAGGLRKAGSGVQALHVIDVLAAEEGSP
jgi:L-lactate dehydrogenase complex protein LldE